MDDPDNDGSDLIEYEPPIRHPGISIDAEYLGRVYAAGTRAILRDAHRRHSELKAIWRRDHDGNGVGGWLATQFSRLPKAAQIGILIVGANLGFEISGAVFEYLTGRPPPQATQPVVVQEPFSGYLDDKD